MRLQRPITTALHCWTGHLPRRSDLWPEAPLAGASYREPRRLQKGNIMFARAFQGRETKQLDEKGRPALRNAWYWEPVGYTGAELYSRPWADLELLVIEDLGPGLWSHRPVGRMSLRLTREQHIARARELKARAWVHRLLNGVIRRQGWDLRSASAWHAALRAIALCNRPEQWLAADPNIRPPGPETIPLIIAKLSDIAMKEIHS